MPDGIAEQDVAKLLGELFRSVSDLRLFAKKLVMFKWGEQIEPSINFDRAPAAVRADFAEQLAAQGALTAEHIGDLIAVLLKERSGQRARIGEVLGSAPPAPAAPAHSPEAEVGAGRGAAPARRPRARKPSGGGAAVSAAAPNGAGADGAGDLQNNAPEVKYDIFFAHASPDKVLAGDVVGRLRAAGLRVFFDADLRDGAWDQVIPAALRASSMVACLCSGAHLEAHYFREEVQLAVKLHRQDAARWRLRPISVRGFPGPDVEWPYGLAVMNAIICGKGQGAAWIAGELLRDFGRAAPRGARGGRKVNPGPAVGADSVQPIGEVGAAQGAHRAECLAAVNEALNEAPGVLPKLRTALKLVETASSGDVAAKLVKSGLLETLDTLAMVKGALGASGPSAVFWGRLAGALAAYAGVGRAHHGDLQGCIAAGGGTMAFGGRALFVGVIHASACGAVPELVYGGRDGNREPIERRTIVWDDPKGEPFLRSSVTDAVVATQKLADATNQSIKPELNAWERGDIGRLLVTARAQARTQALDDVRASIAAFFRKDRRDNRNGPQRIVVLYPPDASSGLTGEQARQRVTEALVAVAGDVAPPVILLPATHDEAEDLMVAIQPLLGDS